MPNPSSHQFNFKKVRRCLPESMGGVVGNIGEQCLVNVKNPGVPPIAGDPGRLGVRRRVISDGLQLRTVEIAGDVVLHEIHALLRHSGPSAGVVGLHREPPATAEQIGAPPAAGDTVGGQKGILFRRYPNDWWGWRCGPGAEGDDERNQAPLDERHTGKNRKNEKLFSCFKKSAFLGFRLGLFEDFRRIYILLLSHFVFPE